MTDVNGAASKPPQISDMFQKFALAFKAKTFEFFADDDGGEEGAPGASGAGEDLSDGFALLDSAEEIITGQRVVVIKPDHCRAAAPAPAAAEAVAAARPRLPEPGLSSTETLGRELERACGLSPEPARSAKDPWSEGGKEAEATSLGHNRAVSWNSRELVVAESRGMSKSSEEARRRGVDARTIDTLISSVFGTVSSFEASYVQLQTAQVPFAEEGVKAADKALVSHLQRLSDVKRFYTELRRNADLVDDLPNVSSLEAQVQENQSKLRILGTISNRLQSEIDRKHSEVHGLKNQLGEIQKRNLKLSKRLSDGLSSSCEVWLCISVFDSFLRDACRATHRFTKILIGLMRKAGWDLNLAANSLYGDVEYEKKGHECYAFLSYVCLVMFRGFDSESFYFGDDDHGVVSNGHMSSGSSSIKKLLEHVSSNPMEVISMDPDSEFARFCEKKYQELIHPSMESSVFSNLDGNEAVLSSWKSLSVFYKSFVEMASSIWTLHKLAFSFDPAVEIFQVERGVEYSLVYMEDVTKRCPAPCKVKPRVGFTVVPGFKIGKTIVQCKVYLSGLKCEG
ncbi:protein GRAVITROPIC IN THE LIGHT 1 [Eucalyptus grandis]|uniref:protein GRAVITROPIC IN THE LIGHT 1 n=1 Tax=Eucalyptus grandis TaxID=71139 RepID=UPI00192EAC25|nr:protein GRAVITROPIC IN THE LIGHT 1 [Eucalyptus grandis]